MAAPEYRPDARLAELLDAWRDDICGVPIPELVALDAAVAIVREERARAGTAPDAVPARNGEESS